MTTPRVGDVYCTRSNTGLGGRLIRIGAALLDKPNTVNHVVIVDHVDEAGTWWGIEGRPGGVGEVDMTNYLASPWTVNNADQPKTDKQREQIVEAVRGLLGRPYDWTGIALDAAEAIGAQHLWKTEWGGVVPAHVVCSSLADWAYEHVGLAAPAADRTCTPADWAVFITTRGWESHKT